MTCFLQVGLLVVMIAALIQGPPLCSDEVFNVNCFYDRSGDDETAYCLQPAGQSNGQTHLTSSQVNGLEAVSCPLSFEMIAIFSNKDDIIINTECTGLSLSINQSVYVNTNVSRVRVVCDETRTFKTISGPSDAFETLRQNINVLTTQCECVERAAAAWSLGAVLTDEYTQNCGTDPFQRVVMDFGTSVTTKLCNVDDSERCLFGTWRIEVRWESDENIDIVIGMPEDTAEATGDCHNLNETAEKICTGAFTADNGRWIITLGPDDRNGTDGGFESATIAIETAPPEKQNFGITIWKRSGPPFDVSVTVKYFFNGVEVASVNPNTGASDAQTRPAWGVQQLHILSLNIEADPDKFTTP